MAPPTKDPKDQKDDVVSIPDATKTLLGEDGTKAAAKRIQDGAKDVPPLIGRETTPALLTLYLQVGVNWDAIWYDKDKTAHARGMTPKMGVFVPEAVKGASKINVIIYLHGNKLRVVHADYSIQEIWAVKDEGALVFPLREQLNESKKPYILVAPTLGAVDQGIDKIGANIDRYLEQIMTGLWVWGGDAFSAKPAVGDLILSGHSGAGGHLLDLASGTSAYKDQVKEIWGFDVLIRGAEDAWRNWAVGHSSTTKVFVYYRAYKDASLLLAKETKGVESVYVLKALAEHDNVLQRHWRERVDAIGTPTENDLKEQAASREPPGKRGKAAAGP